MQNLQFFLTPSCIYFKWFIGLEIKKTESPKKLFQFFRDFIELWLDLKIVVAVSMLQKYNSFSVDFHIA